jgi:hypothetical protein
MPLAAVALCSSSLSAQVTLRQIALPASPPPARTATPAYVPMPTTGAERVPEGTEVAIRLDEPLSSATASAGDVFSISTDEDIRLADGMVIPAGYRGKGEVTAAHKKEMLGKAGELAIRLDYVRIGDVRLHLRAVKSVEGKSTLTTTLVLTLVVTPLFLMHHGHEVVFPKGQRIVAYVDDDAVIPFPIARPPVED